MTSDFSRLEMVTFINSMLLAWGVKYLEFYQILENKTFLIDCMRSFFSLSAQIVSR